jgi:O-antigen ligase
LGAAFFASSLFYAPHRNLGAQRRGQLLIDIAMLAAIAWLLGIANAKTALVCALLGFGTVLLLARTGLRYSPKAALFTILSLAGLVAGVEATFGIREWVIEVLDRDPTLTDRTFLWADVLGIPNNMLLGAGFESFWLGERLDLLWYRYWWHPNQAHNGYIETYINLGIIGVVLMVTMIIASQLRALTLMSIGEAFGPFRFAVLLAIAVLNYTDATFKAVHIVYFVFFLVSISLVRVSASSSAPVEPVDSGFGESPTRPEHAT